MTFPLPDSPVTPGLRFERRYACDRCSAHAKRIGPCLTCVVGESRIPVPISEKAAVTTVSDGAGCPENSANS